jgi:hypothetical protein
MATNRDLLKEAIADAKAVKEMAIANAKAALEEVFTPQLQSMLSAKLQEMEDEDNLEEDFGKFSTDGTEGFSDYEEKALDEDEDMNLEELLKELDEDIEDVEGYEDTDADGIEDDSDADSGEEEISLDLEDMTDEDLKKFIEDVISDMFESGELEANIESEEEEEEAKEGGSEEGEEEEEEEINLEELLAEIEGMDEEMEDEGMMYEEEEDLDEYAEMQPSDYPGMEYDEERISKLESELEEALSVIKTLRGDLNEVNLLNAKLLYTNKIFKSKNLTESQKLNVLSSFDKATTVKETKLVYETLSEGIKSKTNRISENLGSASKGIGTTKTKQPIVESNEMVARFQKLAGII